MRRSLRATTSGAPPRRARGRADRIRAARLGRQQSRQLGVDVQRRLAAAHEALAARVQHLTDFQLALGAARRGRVGGGRRGVVFAFAGDAAGADLVIGAAGAAGEQERDRDITTSAAVASTTSAPPLRLRAGSTVAEALCTTADCCRSRSSPLPCQTGLTDQSIYIHVSAR